MPAEQIRLGHSTAADTRQAAAEFHAAVSQPDMELVIFFCSSQYDLELLSGEFNRLFAGIQLVGCTTAGEIGPAGYCRNTLAGASFAAGSFTVVTGLLENLSRFRPDTTMEFAHSLLQQLERKTADTGPANCFAMMLIDSMAMREEVVANTFQQALGRIRLFGGSAGDDLKLKQTLVYYKGGFRPDAALLVLFNTLLPFRIFKTQHFIPTNERLVVTEAIPDRRIVSEINGLPATTEYSRLIGVAEQELDTEGFAASPVVVLIDGNDYVRSIQKANPDKSLTFFCAIENGIVLRVAHGVDLVENLQQTFDRIRNEIGPMQLVLGCDCVLRRIEISQSNLKDRVTELFTENNTVGFSSYGEQYHGIHVNQTLTGCAIGFTTKIGAGEDDDRT